MELRICDQHTCPQTVSWSWKCSQPPSSTAGICWTCTKPAPSPTIWRGSFVPSPGRRRRRGGGPRRRDWSPRCSCSSSGCPSRTSCTCQRWAGRWPPSRPGRRAGRARGGRTSTNRVATCRSQLTGAILPPYPALVSSCTHQAKVSSRSLYPSRFQYIYLTWQKKTHNGWSVYSQTSIYVLNWSKMVVLIVKLQQGWSSPP